MMLATDVRSIVFERLLPGAAFLGMALLGIAAQDASTGLEWARVFANGGFMGLIGDLFLIRLPRAGERAPLSGALAGLAGTLAPVALSVSPITENEILLATGTTLTVIGLLASVVAVASLGRCFGIFPEARGLVTHGLYRWSRHPVYLGEYIAVGGIVLSSLSVIAIAIYLCFVALQALRASNEERALTVAFPEYSQYAARTNRIVPFVW